LVSLKIVLNFSRFKPALNWNWFMGIWDALKIDIRIDIIEFMHKCFRKKNVFLDNKVNTA